MWQQTTGKCNSPPAIPLLGVNQRETLAPTYMQTDIRIFPAKNIIKSKVVRVKKIKKTNKNQPNIPTVPQ